MRRAPRLDCLIALRGIENLDGRWSGWYMWNKPLIYHYRWHRCINKTWKATWGYSGWLEKHESGRRSPVSDPLGVILAGTGLEPGTDWTQLVNRVDPFWPLIFSISRGESGQGRWNGAAQTQFLVMSSWPRALGLRFQPWSRTVKSVLDHENGKRSEIEPVEQIERGWWRSSLTVSPNKSRCQMNVNVIIGNCRAPELRFFYPHFFLLFYFAYLRITKQMICFPWFIYFPFFYFLFWKCC